VAKKGARANAALNPQDPHERAAELRAWLVSAYRLRARSFGRYLVLPSKIARAEAELLTLELELRALALDEEGSGEGRGGAAGPETRPPLSEAFGAALEILRALPEHRAMPAKELVAEIAKRDPPIHVSVKWIRDNIRRELKPYGLDERRNVGYFVRHAGPATDGQRTGD